MTKGAAISAAAISAIAVISLVLEGLAGAKTACAIYATRPKRPAGLTRSTMAMMTNTTMLEASG